MSVFFNPSNPRDTSNTRPTVDPNDTKIKLRNCTNRDCPGGTGRQATQCPKCQSGYLDKPVENE